MIDNITKALRKRLLLVWFLALSLLTWLPNSYNHESPIQFVFSVLLFCGYLILFWTSSIQLPSIKMTVILLLVGGVTLFKGIYLGPEGFGMIILLGIIIGLRIDKKYSLPLATFFGVVTCVLLIWKTHSYTTHVAPFLLSFIGCYLGARGYRSHHEAYQLNQQHLKELQIAHTKLQDAHNELQEMTVNTLQVAVLEERNRIARDIHDSLGHSLTSLIVQLHALTYMLKSGPNDAQMAVNNMLDVAKQSLEDIRGSVHTLAVDKRTFGLTPLQALLSQTEKNTDLSCTFVTNEEEIDLTNEVTIVFYRILQEAITNTLRHSNATAMWVEIRKLADSIVLAIHDNGQNRSQEGVKPGFGLSGMRERITNLNGTLKYQMREPFGFEITATIPYHHSSLEGNT
ncbi:sensor histidine kinase [Brevibacillus laterosporus]|uniref:sensor histidine kinase n=1 Tax=Brevibacillus laterosporus TaxID=1465 RepID=UPI002652101C|nr:sensor histidine kinase [Brevibacillus laterosporus]MDN9012587.1 sensor histidine kinase [Brevibacillus laterosporus]MDO0943654.1 sensor histidine kinase [Brevibacillus laterosporus]